MAPYTYKVMTRPVGGKTISRHRTLRPAEKSLKRYLRRRSAKQDRPVIYTIASQHGILVSGEVRVPVRVGVVEGPDGREKMKPEGAVVRVMKP